MRQFWNIAVNAFMELIRQPVFLLLMTGSVVFEIFLAVPYYFAFGDEPKLVENSVLAVMLLAGLFWRGVERVGVAGAGNPQRHGTRRFVQAREPRAIFCWPSLAGLAAALTILTYVNMVGALIASRMAFDAYGKTDLPAIGIFAAAIAPRLRAGGFQQLFPAAAVGEQRGPGHDGVDDAGGFVDFPVHDAVGNSRHNGAGGLRLVPAGILILFALWILAALAIACTTRLDTIPTLAICSAVFLLGLMSDYFFGRRAAAGEWWASTLYSIIPNWQLFWLADAVDMGKSTFHWGYVAKAFVYTAGYAGAALAIATALFEERELS